MALWLSVLALVIWVYLIGCHGGFWRVDQLLGEEAVEPLANWPEIVAVIPARNEADMIGQTIESLLTQDYPLRFSIVVVDDGSDDGTAVAARVSAAAGNRVNIVAGKALPEAWVGKAWAMDQGVARAEAVAPDARYILFTDADIVHEASNLRRLVARAESGKLDLVSVMVMLAVQGLWERFLIPPFIFFFQMLYPFAHVNRGRRYAAAGGCMLVRRQALVEAGGLQRIRGALFDDCALSRLIGEQGGALWIGLSTRTRSVRPYGGLSGVWNMVARSAFTQLDYSAPRLAGTVLGMVLTFIVPPLALFGYAGSGDLLTAAAGGAAFVIMAGVFLPTLRLYGQPSIVALFLPVAALLYTGMTLDSAWRHWRGVGGGWKGRLNSK